MTALTFHDLPDDAKQGVISFAADRLTPDGYFLLYDRLRLTEAGTFTLQRSIWARIERELAAACERRRISINTRLISRPIIGRAA